VAVIGAFPDNVRVRIQERLTRTYRVVPDPDESKRRLSEGFEVHGKDPPFDVIEVKSRLDDRVTIAGPASIFREPLELRLSYPNVQTALSRVVLGNLVADLDQSPIGLDVTVDWAATGIAPDLREHVTVLAQLFSDKPLAAGEFERKLLAKGNTPSVFYVEVTERYDEITRDLPIRFRQRDNPNFDRAEWEPTTPPITTTALSGGTAGAQLRLPRSLANDDAFLGQLFYLIEWDEATKVSDELVVPFGLDVKDRRRQADLARVTLVGEEKKELRFRPAPK
jgi:hypothetical protein